MEQNDAGEWKNDLLVAVGMALGLGRRRATRARAPVMAAYLCPLEEERTRRLVHASISETRLEHACRSATTTEIFGARRRQAKPARFLSRIAGRRTAGRSTYTTAVSRRQGPIGPWLSHVMHVSCLSGLTHNQHMGNTLGGHKTCQQIPSCSSHDRRCTTITIIIREEESNRIE